MPINSSLGSSLLSFSLSFDGVYKTLRDQIGELLVRDGRSAASPEEIVYQYMTLGALLDAAAMN